MAGQAGQQRAVAPRKIFWNQPYLYSVYTAYKYDVSETFKISAKHTFPNQGKNQLWIGSEVWPINLM